MKTKIILSLCVLFIISVRTYSQFITGFGLKAGTTISNQNLNYTEGSNVKTRYHVGYNISLFTDFLKNKNFNLQTEAGYDQRGYKLVLERTDEFGNDIGEYTDSYDTHYITAGILAKVKYPGEMVTPYFLAGPRMDIYLGYTSHAPSDVQGAGGLKNPLLEEFKKINYSVSFRAGMEFNKLLPYKTSIEVNYQPQVNTSFNNGFVAVKEYSFNVKLGINFIKRKN